MEKPLADLLVVSLEQAVAAPFCTSRLADAGARVIKVERPEGDFARGYDSVVDGESAYFVWLNRGKESLVLDLRDGGDAALLNRILERADVFIQNLAPGAAVRLGFASADLRSRHPRLITCDISGYGEDGPMRGRKAYDLLIQCESGLASITGTPEAPGRVGFSISDIACGLYAYSAILEAVVARERSGEGAGLEVSLFDATVEWMTVPLLHYDHAGTVQGRVGLNHATIAPYGAYASQDGRLLVFAIQNEREWRRLCDGVLRQPEMANDPRFESNDPRVENRAALDAAIVQVFGELSHDELVARMEAAGIAFANVNSVAELSSHPQLRRIAVDTPGGTARMPAPPARLTGAERRYGPVPARGAQSDAIRREFAPDD